ncbi:hypothetical protein EVAR_68210_1 [Eumeta japonica]|uniref:Uncharacterized protein n=1 Tax=Eumeta variegata TaxID=151549 RepID=A0A4C1SUX5_EUMVA|nr:hypothetical protein EVAR_68210_1 [Eumeta japonica]
MHQNFKACITSTFKRQQSLDPFKDHQRRAPDKPHDKLSERVASRQEFGRRRSRPPAAHGAPKPYKAVRHSVAAYLYFYTCTERTGRSGPRRERKRCGTGRSGGAGRDPAVDSGYPKPSHYSSSGSGPAAPRAAAVDGTRLHPKYIETD